MYILSLTLLSILQILQLGDEQVFGSSNPGVFTDARCFMRWIATQYNMEMPPDYIEPAHCSDTSGRGNFTDIDQVRCAAQLMSPVSKKDRKWIPCAQKLRPTNCGSHRCKPECSNVGNFHESCINKDISGCYEKISVQASSTTCDFYRHFPINETHSEPWKECRNNGTEGFNENIFQCKNSEGKVAICSNNCRGVNPNAIIIGGAAIAIAATVSGNLLLTPAAIGAVGLGAAGAGAVGIGAASGMFVNQCPNRRPCQVSHQYTGSILLEVVFMGSYWLFSPQARQRGNPRRRICCRQVGIGQGRVRCPRVC